MIFHWCWSTLLKKRKSAVTVQQWNNIKMCLRYLVASVLNWSPLTGIWKRVAFTNHSDSNAILRVQPLANEIWITYNILSRLIIIGYINIDYTFLARPVTSGNNLKEKLFKIGTGLSLWKEALSKLSQLRNANLAEFQAPPSWSIALENQATRLPVQPQSLSENIVAKINITNGVCICITKGLQDSSA